MVGDSGPRKNVKAWADLVAWNSSSVMSPLTRHVVPGTVHVRLTVRPVACRRSLKTTSPGSIGTPSTSTQALIAARELLEFFPPLTIAGVRLYGDKSGSIETVAESAPPFEGFSAAGTDISVMGALKPAPLTGANVIPVVFLAKNALLEAAF